MTKGEKRKKSKGKTIAIIIVAIIAVLLIAAVTGGVIYLNNYCKTKEYNVVNVSDIVNEPVTLVAHRGFSAVAPENTAPAFENAMFTAQRTAFG